MKTCVQRLGCLFTLSTTEPTAYWKAPGFGPVQVLLGAAPTPLTTYKTLKRGWLPSGTAFSSVKKGYTNYLTGDCEGKVKIIRDIA